MTNLDKIDKIIELNRDKVIDAIQRVYCIWHKMAMEQDGKNGNEFRCDDYSGRTPDEFAVILVKEGD